MSDSVDPQSAGPLGASAPPMPPPAAGPQPLDPAKKFVTVEMPDKGVGSIEWWLKNIDRDKNIRKKHVKDWKKNLRRYQGEKPTLYGVQSQEVVTVNKDFANTEAKKSQLFFQCPELQLSNAQPQDEQAQPLAQAVINQFLEHEIRIMPTIDEVLMDVICPAGIGFVKIGYQAFLGPDIEEHVMEPAMQPDPGIIGHLRGLVGSSPRMVPVMNPDGSPAMQPSIDPMTWQPKVNLIPNIVREKWYADRVSPTKGIIPSTFTGSDYDDAPYLAMDFLLTPEAIKTEYGVDPSLVATVDIDENKLTEDPDTAMANQMIAGVEIWYHSNYARADVADPLRFTQLVLVNGRGNSSKNGQVLVHRDSPYQILGKRGEYARGMLGNPLHVLTLRYTSDMAYPKSDCTMSRPAVEEVCRSRSQMQQQRARNLPLRWVDKTRDGAKDLTERMQRAETGGVLLTNGPGGELMGVVTPANMPVENFKFNDIFEEDSGEIWALGTNAVGVPDPNATATASTIADRKSEVRMAKERARVLNWYVRLGEKVFSLIQLFADEQQFVEMVGPNGAATLTAWNKQSVSGLFRFMAQPDSSIRIDAAQDRERWLRVYNLFANDPNINRMELDRLVLSKLGADWSRLLNPQPPQPAPEKPRVSLSFTGEDLIGSNPQFSTVAEILKESGLNIDDAAKTSSAIVGVMQEQSNKQAEMVKHPGAAKKVETIDQHSADRTGERSGPKVGQIEQQVGAVR